MEPQNRSVSSSNSAFNSKNKFINLFFVNGQLMETTFKKTFICYIVMSIFFLIFSFITYGLLSTVQYYQLLYYNPLSNETECQTKCQLGDKCSCSLQITKDIQQPIYIMYKVSNFYQNHRRYVQSKNRQQLAGKTVSDKDAQSCWPYMTNYQMGKNYSWGNTILDQQALASPCGAIAKTFFCDTFQIFDSNNNSIIINESGISWDGDKGNKYRQIDESRQLQWINPEDEHFIVWMRTSGLPNFSKLWGIVRTDIKKGNYTIKVDNKYNSTQWEGKRHFIVTNSSIFGGKSASIGTVLLAIGILCIIGSAFFWKKWKESSVKE